MQASILTSVKKVLGLDESYTVFDDDILIHINSAFNTLTDLGIGPGDGYEITDATPTWADYLGNDKNLNRVKTYICLRVRLVFDPPTTQYLQTAMQEQIREIEWRLNVKRENDVNPAVLSLTDVENDSLVVDGGEL